MTLSQFERAMLARFAWDEAGTRGLATMRAVCLVMRNRVRMGWHEGSWTLVMSHAEHYAGTEREAMKPLDPRDRNFQMLLRDIDDIYHGADEGDTAAVVGDCLYYHFIDRPVRPWFAENIIRESEAHPRRAHVGNMAMHE